SAHGAASSSAWLNPRSASRPGWSGTGITASAQAAGGAGRAAAPASASQRPSGRATAGRRANLSAWIAARIPSRYTATARANAYGGGARRHASQGKVPSRPGKGTPQQAHPGAASAGSAAQHGWQNGRGPGSSERVSHTGQ